MKIQIALTVFAFMSGTVANAAISATKDYDVFQYKYEMDVNPTEQDLDGNATIDWSGTATTPVSGGIPVSGGFARNTANEQVYRGDFTGGVFRGISGTNTSDWTFEVNVAKLSGTQGTNGWFGVAFRNQGDGNPINMYLKDDRVSVAAVDYLVGSFVATNANNIRVAHDSVANSYYVWVNGQLLNANLTTPILANGNPGANANYILVGDFSPSIAGNFQIDRMALDSVAAAPNAVPEPSVVALLGLGALGMMRRRR